MSFNKEDKDRLKEIFWQWTLNSIRALILDELEKIRRYASWRFRFLVQYGLRATLETGQEIGDNTMGITIRITIPRDFMESLADKEVMMELKPLLNYDRRRDRRHHMWSEEMHGERGLELTELDSGAEEELEGDVEVELVEGDQDNRSRHALGGPTEDSRGLQGERGGPRAASAHEDQGGVG